MSVPIQKTVFNYVANGATTSFAYECYVIEASDLSVYLDDVLQPSGYTVTGVGNLSGGDVVFGVAPASGVRVRIERDVDVKRDTQYQILGDFRSPTVNNDFDRLWMVLQRIAYFLGMNPGQFARVLMLGPGDVDGQGAYRARQNRIQDLRDPVNAQDAVNLQTLLQKIAEFSTDGTGQAVLQLLADTTGPANGDARVGVKRTDVQNTVGRTQHAYNADTDVSVSNFLQPGDIDWRNAILVGDAACYFAGKRLWFPAGVYRCGNGIPGKKATWVGAGAPVLGTFPIVDDKRFLRPGYKDQMPGTTLLFTGTGTVTATTQRTDRFASFTYCVKTEPGIPSGIRGLAIVQDMDVYDADGNLTTWSTDNRASYDVGYMVDDSPRCMHSDFVVFGYFPKAGTVVASKEATGYLGDPDYCTFFGGSTSGDIGLALIGSQSNDGFSSGLSGTSSINFNIFAKDHHSRDNVVDDWGTCCLYIDGFTTAVNDDINGHYFTNLGIRTYGNNPIMLDHASNTEFVSVVFETPLRGTPKSNATQFLATTNTNDVTFTSCRWSNDAGLYNSQFAGQLRGQLINVAGPFGGIIVTEKDPATGTVYSVRLGGASAGSGRPSIQFLSGSPTSSTNGWVLTRDKDNADVLDIRWNNVSRMMLHTDGGIGKFGFRFGGTKTIAAGAIDVGEFSSYAVDTEGAAATDDLETITGASFAGQRLVLRAANSGRDVVVKDTVGNLRTAGDFTLTHAHDRIELEWDGATWVEITRSDNTA